MQRNGATKAEGLVHGAGINSMAQVKELALKQTLLSLKGRQKVKQL